MGRSFKTERPGSFPGIRPSSKSPTGIIPVGRFLENTMESQLDIGLKIGKISGSYITDLSLSNVTTQKPASTGTLAALDIRGFEVTYNLLSFSKGLNGFLTDLTVELEGAKVDLQLSKSKKQPAAPAEKTSSQPFFLPEQLPRIHVKDTSVYLRGADYGTAFEGIDLETRRSRALATSIRLNVSDWSWTHPNLFDGKAPLSVEIAYSREQLIVKQLVIGATQVVEYVQVGLSALVKAIQWRKCSIQTSHWA